MNNKEKLIQEMIMAEEKVEITQLQGIRQKVWETLTKEKFFDPGDIEIDPEFRLKLSNCEATVSIDFIINLDSVSFMVIKCSSTAMESWERYVISFARAVKDYQIPYAMITDGENVRVIDVITGSLLCDSIQRLFTKQDAINKMKDFKKIPYSPNRLEKAKRIIYAFEGIKCPTVSKT
jgi:hypothetical protein